MESPGSVWMLTGAGCRGRGRHLIRVTARGSPEAPRCHFPTLMSLCVTRHFLMWLASKIISLLWGQGGICFSSVMIQMSLLSCHYKEAGAARLGFLEVRRGCEACPGLRKAKNNLSGETPETWARHSPDAPGQDSPSPGGSTRCPGVGAWRGTGGSKHPRLWWVLKLEPALLLT